MRRGGVDVAIWIVIAIAVAFTFFLVLVREARAEEPKSTDTYELRVLGCGPSLCAVVKEDLEVLEQSNNANFARAEKAEAELAKLKRSCTAKLEVTEPPRWTPKKERDS